MDAGNTSCSIVVCTDPHCVTCSSNTVCSLCDTVNGWNIQPDFSCANIPVVCVDTHCTLCSAPNVCTQCDTANGWYVQGDATCGTTPPPVPPSPSPTPNNNIVYTDAEIVREGCNGMIIKL